MKEAQIDQIQLGLMRQAERFFILQRIDTLWREHLQQMDALRESVGLRGYGQKDPLIEYKREGYELFLDMMVNIRRDVVYSLFMFQPPEQQNAEMRFGERRVGATCTASVADECSKKKESLPCFLGLPGYWEKEPVIW
ncbi:MAG: hypothetical protein AN485_23670 [Anabaena sp. MDT14b]|nr:MAG: hypothetical protein AN485_23670 [Anabaena sp. MDT14b]